MWVFSYQNWRSGIDNCAFILINFLFTNNNLYGKNFKRKWGIKKLEIFEVTEGYSSGIGGIAGYAYRFFLKTSFGYLGSLVIIQSLSAVTGACLMMRKDVFSEVEGFNEIYPLAVSNIDICLKTREKGYLVVYTPYTELYHYELKTRGFDDAPEKQERFKKEIELFKKKWGYILENGDPYYNPNLTIEKENFSYAIQSRV